MKSEVDLFQRGAVLEMDAQMFRAQARRNASGVVWITTIHPGCSTGGG
jgi:hypothetical protein